MTFDEAKAWYAGLRPGHALAYKGRPLGSMYARAWGWEACTVLARKRGAVTLLCAGGREVTVTFAEVRREALGPLTPAMLEGIRHDDEWVRAYRLADRVEEALRQLLARERAPSLPALVPRLQALADALGGVRLSAPTDGR